ncbi:MAG TPA: SIMPL domain-containing protein [Rhizomicrobium sp.]|nr:SIMPL domain-containing protein [Rhizomicrobium sp.]
MTKNRMSQTALAALMFASIPALAAAQPAMMPHPHVLSVSGQGEVRAIPDQAQLTAGVVTQGKTAAAALAANSTAMNEVFATLKKRGIPDKSIATSNFSINPQYPPYRQDAPNEDRSRIVGYEVSNQVTAIVDDTSKVGTILDALVSSGANQAGGVSFNIRDPKPLMKQAREDAVKEAVDKAQTLAKAAGVTLGPIMSISEGGYVSPMPMFAAKVAMAAPMAAPPPVAAGEQSVTANVNITWEIQ